MSYAAHHKDFRSFVTYKATVDGTTVEGEWTKSADANGPWWKFVAHGRFGRHAAGFAAAWPI